MENIIAKVGATELLYLSTGMPSIKANMLNKKHCKQINKIYNIFLNKKITILEKDILLYKVYNNLQKTNNLLPQIVIFSSIKNVEITIPLN